MVPFDDNTCPADPTVVIPVPPELVGIAVPEYASANTPDVVMVDGVTVRKVGAVIPTEVTVPTAGVPQVIVPPAPPDNKDWPVVPASIGSLNVELDVAAVEMVVVNDPLDNTSGLVNVACTPEKV